ncbi:hypothetical protein NUKP67_46420 [Klebsiella variicola]|nr:hypothetical protein NUKP67_46420 [Klebsiella variicola]GKO88076.1 hypothetical protein NUBL21983_45160 [Klebsiella variicola]
MLYIKSTTLRCNLVVDMDRVNNFMWFDCDTTECKDVQKKEAVWKISSMYLTTHTIEIRFLPI